jgi:hypothetical protein
MKTQSHSKSYDTLSEAMNALKEEGFTYEFDFKDNILFNHYLDDKKFNSNELKVVQIHRFEGISNPDDNSILYAIESLDGVKGLLVDAYGMYADADKTEFMKNVEIISE